MKRRYTRHRKVQEYEVDITSLLDILTILLVFLLKSYNSSDLKLDLVKNLTMPDSEARDITTYAPVVQINKGGDIYLNNNAIGRVPASGEMPDFTKQLKEVKTETEKYNSTHKTQLNPELVNLVFDKDMDYAIVKRVMHNSALAGYSQFKFIVKGNY